jgi:hypothetical protein
LIWIREEVRGRATSGEKDDRTVRPDWERETEDQGQFEKPRIFVYLPEFVQHFL